MTKMGKWLVAASVLTGGLYAGGGQIRAEAPAPSILQMENGKYDIQSTKPGTLQKSVFANFEKKGEYVLYNKKKLPLYNAKNGSVAGWISPQIIRSAQRSGEWFLVDTYLGKKWIYNDDAVELRDLDMKNASLSLVEATYVYSNPFDAYKTKEKLEPQTVKVLKQAGEWFLIETASQRQLWVYSATAKYRDVPGEFSIASIYGVPYKKMIVPLGNESVRPAYTMRPTYITIHNTANPSRGANALLHANYLINQAKTNKNAWVSWHFTVDNTQIIQHLPLNENGWHAGDGEGPGNRSSIGIEIAENADGNYAKAEENAKKLVAYLMKTYGLEIEQVQPHQNWSGKYCPHIILDRSWSAFTSSVQSIYNSYNQTVRYRVATGGFVGASNAKAALDRLQKDTGWWAAYEPNGQTAPYYRLVGQPVLGEAAAKSDAELLQKQTGWRTSYEETEKSELTYRVVTGSFTGESAVKTALQKLQKDTGWWAAYEKTGKPNQYRIVTGNFIGEEQVKAAVSRVQQLYGWSAAYEKTGSKPYYQVIVNEFLGEKNAKDAVAVAASYDMEMSYEATGKQEPVYRIVTGGFGSEETAKQQAAWVTEKYGWFAAAERMN